MKSVCRAEVMNNIASPFAKIQILFEDAYDGEIWVDASFYNDEFHCKTHRGYFHFDANSSEILGIKHDNDIWTTKYDMYIPVYPVYDMFQGF